MSENNLIIYRYNNLLASSKKKLLRLMPILRERYKYMTIKNNDIHAIYLDRPAQYIVVIYKYEIIKSILFCKDNLEFYNYIDNIVQLCLEDNYLEAFIYEVSENKLETERILEINKDLVYDSNLQPYNNYGGRKYETVKLINKLNK